MDPEWVIQEETPHPEKETQEVPLDPGQETREAPSDREEETREAPSDPEDEVERGDTGGATGSWAGDMGSAIGSREERDKAGTIGPDEEAWEAPSYSEEETKDVAGLVAGSTYVKGSVVPARRKLTIRGNPPLNNTIAHVESTGACRRGSNSATRFSADDGNNRRGRRRGQCVGV